MRKIPVVHAIPGMSTSVETRAIRRLIRVMSRLPISKKIASAGVYNCRPVRGSTTPSQHAWGNAADLMLTPGGDHDAVRKAIANAVVFQATNRTFKNRGLKLAVSQVIDHDGRRIWEPGKGWFPYTGVTGDHVHVSGAPYLNGLPPCMRGA